MMNKFLLMISASGKREISRHAPVRNGDLRLEHRAPILAKAFLVNLARRDRNLSTCL